MKLKRNIYAAIAAGIIMTTGSVSYANELNQYETYTKPLPKVYQQNQDIPEEVKLDLSELSNIKYFKLKTNSKYEVALAYANGDYTFVQGVDTFEEATKIANDLEKEYALKNIIPTVINSDGIIAYTTDSIGRIVKIGDGISENSIGYIANIYTDSNKKTAHTYINHGFVDDVPVIEETETMAKIEVSGYTGWIEKSDKDGTNMILVPINQATNLSYYENVNGQLVHYISTNIQGSSGHKRSIGRAADFMKPGVKYYSYDGNYFYDDINNLLADTEANHHNNAVNNNSPYYSYYQYLSGRSKSGYSADDINRYFEANTPSDSVLRNTGEYFIRAQSKYGVNANFMIGIAMNESARGTSNYAKTKNNIFGIDAKDANPDDAKLFNSIEECINVFAKDWMSNRYLNPKGNTYYGSNLGNKNLGCNVKYASDPFWSEKAASFMNEMDVYFASQNIEDDYNRYKIGIFNKVTDVNTRDNENLYSSKVDYVTIVSNDKTDKVEISPDRTIPMDVTNPIPGSHDWRVRGYVSKDSINIINQPQNDYVIESIKGIDRYETASLIADNQHYNTAILVNAETVMADGLSASGLAGVTNAPILLTQKEYIPNHTQLRLEGVNKVYIVGGETVISKDVENKLKSNNIEVVRLGGLDRCETSYLVAEEINKISNIDKIFLVNGFKGEADAMSVSPIASRDGAPIILTDGEKIPFDARFVKSYVIGSNHVMSDNIVNKTNSTRLGGIDRFETNNLVIKEFYNNPTEFYISKGFTLVDALTISPLAKGYPVVLADKNTDKSILQGATRITKLGGIDESIIDECIEAIKK